MTATKSNKSSLNLESMELRDTPAVMSAFLVNNYGSVMLQVNSSSTPTDVSINTYGSYAQVRDNATGGAWYFDLNSFGAIRVNGSNGDDRIVNNVSTKSLYASGLGGNDYLEGYSQRDYLSGGTGNDTIKGYGGDDSLSGGAGNDTIYGMDGNDTLNGDDGSDFITGGNGNDYEIGGSGNNFLAGYWTGGTFVGVDVLFTCRYVVPYSLMRKADMTAGVSRTSIDSRFSVDLLDFVAAMVVVSVLASRGSRD